MLDQQAGAQPHLPGVERHRRAVGIDAECPLGRERRVPGVEPLVLEYSARVVLLLDVNQLLPERGQPEAAARIDEGDEIQAAVRGVERAELRPGNRVLPLAA